MASMLLFRPGGAVLFLLENNRETPIPAFSPRRGRWMPTREGSARCRRYGFIQWHGQAHGFDGGCKQQTNKG